MNENVNNANTNIQTKSYSFLNIKKSIGRNEQPFNSVTVSGLVVNPTDIERTGNGRDYIRFSMPIRNQGPRIWSACEIAPEADKDGTVWANVTLWNGNAARFKKYLERHPHSVIVVTGSIRVEKVTAANGNVYINTNISADDFMHVRDIRPREDSEPKRENGRANTGSTGSVNAASNAGNASAGNDAPGGNDAEEFDMNSKDLPF